MHKLGFAAALLIVGAGAGMDEARAEQPAGRVLWTFGHVERVGSDGVAKPLAQGGLIFEGDLIRAARDSHAQLVMSDDALIALRPDTSLQLKRYAYAGREDGGERAVLELIKGGLRSVTGAIGRTHKEHYLLRSGQHVVGIRGTDHETFATPAGTYNRVTLGGTYLQSAAGRVELAPGETGFIALAPGSAPSRLHTTPDFMHLAAVTSGNTGPRVRDAAAADAARLEKAAPAARPNAPGTAALPKGTAGDALKTQPGKGNGRGGSKGH